MQTRKKLNLQIQIGYEQGLVESVSFIPSSDAGMHWTFSSQHVDQKLESQVTKWLEGYLQNGETSVKIPLNWDCLPSFTRKALQIVATIPFGKFLTYGEVAKSLGHPESARAVGGACGRNPFLLFVPCHRVLDSNLKLRGFSAGGLTVKEALLNFEGVCLHTKLNVKLTKNNPSC